jgi:hypothetical protein
MPQNVRPLQLVPRVLQHQAQRPPAQRELVVLLFLRQAGVVRAVGAQLQQPARRRLRVARIGQQPAAVAGRDAEILKRLRGIEGDQRPKGSR